MTCIVGISYDGKVMLGADSAGCSGYDRRTRADGKVFTNGDLAFGFTSSFRMGQLLRYNLSPPLIGEGQNPYEYLVKALIPSIRDVLRTGGFTKTDNGREEGGVFLVGFRGRLFSVYGDFQVGEDVDTYAAVGCGDAYAMGAMHASPTLPPRERLLAGLRAAEAFSAGVVGPFNYVVV